MHYYNLKRNILFATIPAGIISGISLISSTISKLTDVNNQYYYAPSTSIWQFVFLFIILFVLLTLFFYTGVRANYWFGKLTSIDYLKNGKLLHRKFFDSQGRLIHEQTYEWDKWKEEFEKITNLKELDIAEKDLFPSM